MFNTLKLMLDGQEMRSINQGDLKLIPNQSPFLSVYVYAIDLEL